MTETAVPSCDSGASSENMESAQPATSTTSASSAGKSISAGHKVNSGDSAKVTPTGNWRTPLRLAGCVARETAMRTSNGTGEAAGNKRDGGALNSAAMLRFKLPAANSTGEAAICGPFGGSPPAAEPIAKWINSAVGNDSNPGAACDGPALAKDNVRRPLKSTFERANSRGFGSPAIIGKSICPIGDPTERAARDAREGL